MTKPIESYTDLLEQERGFVIDTLEFIVPIYEDVEVQVEQVIATPDNKEEIIIRWSAKVAFHPDKFVGVKGLYPVGGGSQDTHRNVGMAILLTIHPYSYLLFDLMRMANDFSSLNPERNNVGEIVIRFLISQKIGILSKGNIAKWLFQFLHIDQNITELQIKSEGMKMLTRKLH